MWSISRVLFMAAIWGLLALLPNHHQSQFWTGGFVVFLGLVMCSISDLVFDYVMDKKIERHKRELSE